ncbi:MAG: diguanylate cyclase [Pseudomonadota bacterium]
MLGLLLRQPISCALLLTLSGWVSANTQIWTEPHSVEFEMLTLADGLSDSTVFSIDQDQRGRIWLGSSSGGANVFDGYQVESFLHQEDDPQSLSHSGAGEVLATQDGRVFVGTWGGGLNLRLGIDGRFEQINSNGAPTHIQVMFEDQQGTVWIGSADSGLWRLEPEQDEPVQVQRFDDESFERIWSITDGPNGSIWVATFDGWFEVGGSGPAPSPIDGWGRHPRALTYDGQWIWIADGEAVYRSDGGRPVAVEADFPLINTLAMAPNGQILIGTLSGIHALNSDGERAAPFDGTDLALFPERNIRRFHFDRSGVGWIATREAGVIKAQPTVPGFDGYLLDSDLDTADAILELAPDDVLIGSRRGLWRLRQEAQGLRFYRVPATETLAIIHFARRNGDVLLGTRNGILAFDPVTETLSRPARFAVHDDQMVTSLRSHLDGSVDVGTWSAGLYRYGAEGDVRRYAPDADSVLPDQSISDIESDGAGGIWVGLWNAGVAHIDRAGVVDIVDRETLIVDGNVHDVLPLGDELWVATSFGLARHDLLEAKTTRLILMPDFPNSAVQRLAAGADRLWAATTRGLMAVDLSDASVTRFGTSDGLVVDEFYARSGDLGDAGRIYFGGLGGFVSFQPDEVMLSPQPPSAAVVSAWIDGNPVPVDTDIELPPLADTLRLRFIADDHRQASANRFRWRLHDAEDAEADAEWSPVSAEPEAFFVGLEPGEYDFELQAANSNGLWNVRAASLRVEVQPTWWQTPWGQSGLLVAALLSIWLFSYWNTQRIRIRNRQLQAEVNQQTEALRRANRSLEVSASTDYLTKLLNRRGFLSRVDAEPPVLQHFFAVIDVDNFKLFNDRFGHETGDQVLQKVAALLLARTRDDDVVARWGGEEFIVRLNAADHHAAIEAAERLRESIAQETIEPSSNIPVITVTIGLAQQTAGEDAMVTINRADSRLLVGKQTGKNRVISID